MLDTLDASSFPFRTRFEQKYSVVIDSLF